MEVFACRLHQIAVQNLCLHFRDLYLFLTHIKNSVNPKLDVSSVILQLDLKKTMWNSSKDHPFCHWQFSHLWENCSHPVSGDSSIVYQSHVARKIDVSHRWICGLVVGMWTKRGSKYCHRVGLERGVKRAGQLSVRLRSNRFLSPCLRFFFSYLILSPAEKWYTILFYWTIALLSCTRPHTFTSFIVMINPFLPSR